MSVELYLEQCRRNIDILVGESLKGFRLLMSQNIGVALGQLWDSLLAKLCRRDNRWSKEILFSRMQPELDNLC